MKYLLIHMDCSFFNCRAAATANIAPIANVQKKSTSNKLSPFHLIYLFPIDFQLYIFKKLVKLGFSSTNLKIICFYDIKMVIFLTYLVYFKNIQSEGLL